MRRAFAARGTLVVDPGKASAQPSSMRCPRGAASVAWQSTTRTGSAASIDTGPVYSATEDAARALTPARASAGAARALPGRRVAAAAAVVSFDWRTLKYCQNV